MQQIYVLTRDGTPLFANPDPARPVAYLNGLQRTRDGIEIDVLQLTRASDVTAILALRDGYPIVARTSGKADEAGSRYVVTPVNLVP